MTFTHLEVAICGTVPDTAINKWVGCELFSMPDRRRALMTDKERERLAGEGDQKRQYEAISRVRRKITEELPEDVEILRKHHPKLYSELQDVVCRDA